MNPIKILLVDDSRSARYALRLQLQRHDVVVETADSAEAGLALIQESPPDAVFMDHTMPGMNGFEALEILKSAPATAHIPVVMCTSNEDPVFIDQARRKGALDILSKSTAPDKLPSLIQHLKETVSATSAPAPVPVPEPASTPIPVDDISRIARQEAERIIGERLDERVRAIVGHLVDDLDARLSAHLAANTEEKSLARFQEEAKRLQQHFIHAQSEQAHVTTNRLVNELLPSLVQEQVAKGTEGLTQSIGKRIAQERQQLVGTAQEMITTALIQLPKDPAFLQQVLDATGKTAVRAAEKALRREARDVAEGIATKRADEAANSLSESTQQSLRTVYLLAAGAAGVGIAAAAVVYLLVA